MIEAIDSSNFVRPIELGQRVLASDLPPDLVAACARGECVLFAGGGVSMRAGFPDWKETLRHLLNYFSRAVPTVQVADLRAALADDDLRLVAELLLARAGRVRVAEALRDCYKRSPRYQDLPYQALRQIPFFAVITTGWERIWEKVFQPRKTVEVYSTETASSHRLLHSDSFDVVRLYGSYDDPESLVLTRDGYRAALQENRLLHQSLNSLVASNSLLFVGATPSVVDEFLASLQFRGHSGRAHYAIVAQDQGIDLLAESLWYKYNVRLLTYDPALEWTTIRAALETTAQEAHRIRGGHGNPRSLKSMPLERVVLENIGPYEQLKLDLGPGWNVILGNNGCGKSTILRAVALGLCGDDPEAAQAGRRLLRVDTPKGSIELTIGGTLYRTELVRDATGVRVICNQLTPLNAGLWVALGFPPLRGMSDADPRGPTADGQATPSVEDVLPLLTGVADQRLSNLKQWVVNLDARTRTDGGTPDAAAALRYRKLRESLFQVLESFTPGMPIRFAHIDSLSWQVMVQTEDGIVPIDQVSQGMSSIIGWVGTLIQRLHEIYSGKDAPEKEPAFVLIDELDAHLHPEWQQKLVGIVRKIFPAVQILATTHSPLLIAGLEKEELTIARRRLPDGALEIWPAPISPVGMRADQILTSPLFGLTHTRDQRLHARYDELLARSELTEDETAELQNLRARIAPMMTAGDSLLERAVQTVVQDVLSDDVDNVVNTMEFLTGGLSVAALERVKATLSPLDLSAADMLPAKPKLAHRRAAQRHRKV